jgi:PAS domain S-box-containing protein
VLWEYNLDKRSFSYVSPSVTRMTGFTPEESLERTLDEALVPASLKKFREAIAFMIAHPNVAKNALELEVRRKDGSTIWTEDAVSIIHDAEGNATEVVGITRDISERYRAQEEQKRFISMVSHEFRTPLATIDGAIQRLASTSGDISEATRKRFTNIQHAADRLTTLLDDYLNQDYLGTMGRKLHLGFSSPRVLLKDALDSSAALSAEHHFTLLAEGLPASVLCDPDLMRLVLRVLTDNAVKHTPPGTEICLSCRPARGNGVEFLIADNGPGIPPDELSQIFDKFFRGRKAGQTVGSGLGLHLAQSVVESHGGSLSARNLAQGGAEFRVWLPDSPVSSDGRDGH